MIFFLTFLMYNSFSQKVTFYVIDVKNYDQWIYSNKTDKSLLINDAVLKYNNGNVYYDSVSKTYSIDNEITDSCILFIDHPNYKNKKVHLFLYKSLIDISIVLGNRDYEYLYSDLLPFKPINDLIIIDCIQPLNDKQKFLIDSLNLIIVDSLYQGYSGCYYYLKKMNNKIFDRVGCQSIKNLRESGLFNVVGVTYKETIILTNQAVITLRNSMEIDSLKVHLKEINYIDYIFKSNSPYSYEIVFDTSIGYGIIDEINKLFEIENIVYVVVNFNRLLKLD